MDISCKSLLMLAMVATAATPTPARSQGMGLEVTAGYNALTGQDFDPLANDLGYEVVGSHAWTSGWALGIGTGMALHHLDSDILEAGVEGSANIATIFVEGRYRFGVPRSRDSARASVPGREARLFTPERHRRR